MREEGFVHSQDGGASGSIEMLRPSGSPGTLATGVETVSLPIARLAPGTRVESLSFEFPPSWTNSQTVSLERNVLDSNGVKLRFRDSYRAVTDAKGQVWSVRTGAEVQAGDN